jgi:hypothetical protein
MTCRHKLAARPQSPDCRRTTVKHARQSWAVGSSAFAAQKPEAAWVVAFAHPGANVSLQPEDPCFEVDPLRRTGLVPRDPQQVQRRLEAGGRPQVRRGGEPFRGRVRRRPCGSEGGSGLLPRRQRLLPPALKLQRGGQAAGRGTKPTRITAAATSLDDLAPGPDRLPKVTGQLRAPGEALQDLSHPSGTRAAPGPRQPASGCSQMTAPTTRIRLLARPSAKWMATLSRSSWT